MASHSSPYLESALSVTEPSIESIQFSLHEVVDVGTPPTLPSASGNPRAPDDILEDQEEEDHAGEDEDIHPVVLETPGLTVEIYVAPFYHPSYSEAKFSLREIEEIYLARRSRELTTAAGKHEEDLGRHLTSCMRSINALKGIHKEMDKVERRQALLSNGASRETPVEYELEMRYRITLFESASGLSESRRRHQPSLSSLARKLRILGHTFYAQPSLLSVSFNRLWNSLWS